MSSAEYERYIYFILAKQSCEINFEKNYWNTNKNFRDRTSLFNAQWNCLKLVKCDDDDFITYAGVNNWECKKFKLNELTSDSFKCLIFIQSLTSNKDAKIRSRILTKLEMDSKLILQK